MPRLDARHWADATYRDTVHRWIDGGVRAFGVFLGTIDDTASMLSALQARAGNGLLFGADYEYGLAMRLDDAVAMPRAMALGRTRPSVTEHLARIVAEEAAALGIHWNWAPVCDLNSNPENPIINTRAFGSSAEKAIPHIEAWIRGTQAGGLLACAKHAPGHGDTTVDSHLGLPVLDIAADVLDQREAPPFRAALAAGVDSVMMGHLVVPFLDPDRPASLSPAAVNGLVRTVWGFDGLVTTDALDMGAITGRWSAGEAAVAAILAGNDVVLLPADVDAAIDAIAVAMADGRIDEERLLASERRWATARRTLAAVHRPVAVDQQSHAMMALQAADAALRFDGDVGTLPLTQYGQVAVFAIVGDDDMELATRFLQYLAQATEIDMDMGFIDGTMSDDDLVTMRQGVEGAEAVLFLTVGRAVAHRGTMPGYDRLGPIMTALAAGRPSILVACGSPYGVETLPASLRMYTFSETVPSMAAAVFRCAGRTAVSPS